MTDFVSGLRSELVAAAAREQRRRLAWLPALRLRPLVPALVAAALLALALVLVLGQDRPGEQRRVVSPPQEARPLFGGTLDPGVRYKTQSFVPALSLSFPTGRWIADSTDARDFLVFTRDSGRANTLPLGAVAFTRNEGRVYDPGVRDLERSLAPAPSDLFSWLRAHPDVDAAAPRSTRLAGRDARVMDFTYRFDRPRHAALACEGLGDRCTAIGPGLDYHRDGERNRAWELDTSEGKLFVFVSGADEAAFQKTLAAARPTLDSLEIDD